MGCSGWRPTDGRAPRSGAPSKTPLRHSRSPAYNLSVARLLVDQVQERAARQVAREVFLDQRDLTLPEAMGARGDVRGDQDVGERPQWMVRRQRLGREDVEPRAADAARTQRIDQRGLVDQRAAP